MIKKIKNIKWSESKNQEEVKWIELIAKRNRLLLESDWTQLPDVNLTEQSRTQWKNWRESLRQLSRFSIKSTEDYKNKLNKLINERDHLFIEYTKTESIKDVQSGKEYLHKLLVQFYEEKMNFKFSPNLEEKYQEALDIIAFAVSQMDDPVDIESMNMDELKEFISQLDEIEVDIKQYPFFELTKRLKFLKVNDAILYLLNLKEKQYNFSLQEEYNMIHYEHLIDSCTTVESLLDVKRVIEMNYGH